MKTVKKELVVKNKLGLHARPAAMFVQIANKFDSKITVVKDDQEVNGKSIMGILMLAAERDSAIVVTATGSDAEQALAELEQLVCIEDMDSITMPKHIKPKTSASLKKKA